MKKNNLDYIHDLLAKLDHQMDDMNETLIKHDANLAEHMRRTELLEEQIVPVKKHVDMMQGVAGFVALLALIATIYAAVR
jgi:cytochrome c-type biogenesis protein CcmH/NrfG